MKDFKWAVQLARGRHPGWDWMTEASDFGETVKFAGRQGATLTPIIYLSKANIGDIMSPATLTTWLDAQCGAPISYAA